ncbi:NlpC/P60 family protein [Nocardia sp. bgisy134]|uniref:C40 family peptidase n=1 Tax=unclassified Nocardia TaxID=2637762 RepID=UPI003D73CA82
MASTAEGRYSRFLRRAIFWGLAAAAAIGALLVGAGQASAKPVAIPGIGVFEVPDAIPVPPAFTEFDYPDIRVRPSQVVPAVIDEPAAVDMPVVVDVPAAIDVPAVVSVPAAIDVPAVVNVPAAVDVATAVEIPAGMDVSAAVSVPVATDVSAAVDHPAVVDLPAIFGISLVDIARMTQMAESLLPVTHAPAIAGPPEVVYTAPLAVIEFAATPPAPQTAAAPQAPASTTPSTPIDLLRAHLPFLAGLLEPVLPAPFAVPKPPVVEHPSPGAIAVEAARAKIGSDYSMGATGPDVFDCSGLVQWSYEQAGVDVPRTSYQQLSSGMPISQEELEPGDVVSFYGGGHSGLYAGDGQVIHASTYGTGVVMSPMSSMPYAGARRY